MSPASGSDPRLLSPTQLVHATLLLAIGSVLIAGQVALGVVQADPKPDTPAGPTTTTLLALPDLDESLSPLNEVHAAVQRTLTAPTARWDQVFAEATDMWEVYGEWDGEAGRTGRRIVLEDAHMQAVGLGFAPGTPDRPHYLTVVEGRTLWYAVPYGSEATGSWVQAPTELLGQSEPLFRAGAYSTPADIDPEGGVPIRPFLEATSATFTGEDPAGRHFDLVLPGPAVAEWYGCNQVVPRTGLEPAVMRELIPSSSTGTVTIGPDGTLVAASVDLAPIAGDLVGVPDVDAPGEVFTMSFRSIEVGVPARVVRPTGTYQLG